MLLAGNNRVLFYPSGLTTPTVVYGQSSFTAFSTLLSLAVGASAAHGPIALALDGNGNLFMADYYNHRVLLYPTGGVTKGVAQPAATLATAVFGQADFGSGLQNKINGTTPSASGMWNPDGLTVDASGNLYVADFSNNRALFFPAGQVSGAALATRVYGQF